MASRSSTSTSVILISSLRKTFSTRSESLPIASFWPVGLNNFSDSCNMSPLCLLMKSDHPWHGHCTTAKSVSSAISLLACEASVGLCWRLKLNSAEANYCTMDTCTSGDKHVHVVFASATRSYVRLAVPRGDKRLVKEVRHGIGNGRNRGNSVPEGCVFGLLSEEAPLSLKRMPRAYLLRIGRTTYLGVRNCCLLPF